MSRRKTNGERRAKRLFKSRILQDGTKHTPNIIQESALFKVEVPKSDKVVHKVVPARAGDEVIGEAVIYEDGTIDVIAFADISDEARGHLHSFQAHMMGIDDEDYTPQFKSKEK